MILRPQRYRTIVGFVLGLSVSAVVLGLAYFYYSTHVYTITEEEKASIRTQAIDEYIKKNPTTEVTIAAVSKKAGEVLTQEDIVKAEISSSLAPEGAFTEASNIIGKALRCDIPQSTIIIPSFLYEEADYPDDLRRIEYTVINLPRKLESSEYVDIRVMFPNGLDYIVLSKKKVVDLELSESGSNDVIWLHVGEDEILRMASAIVDASKIENAILYAAPYVAPDVQSKAHQTYPPNSEVQSLILQNPNVVDKAISQLEERNRRLFEERINTDNQLAGRNKIFGEHSEVIHPAINEEPADENLVGGASVDGRV